MLSIWCPFVSVWFLMVFLFGPPFVFPVVPIVILTFLVVFGTNCVSFPFFKLLA